MRAYRPSRTVPRDEQDRLFQLVGAEQVRLSLLDGYARRAQAGLPLFVESDVVASLPCANEVVIDD